MTPGQTFHDGPYGHPHDGPHGNPHGGAAGHITQPRRYEYAAAIAFLGQRRRVFDRLLALSGAQQGDRMLDVGSGTGYLARRAARVVGPAGRVVGLDPSAASVAYAAHDAPSNVSFHVAGAEAIPEPDASFDVVVSILTIHHIPPALRPVGLREMRRVLRPGGHLLIADFRPPSSKIANRLIGALTGHAMQHNPIDQLPDLITDAGFGVTGHGDHKPWLAYIQAIPRD
jgi:ubiquinone/menaquinone biosynthesis C-methylase UbiE